MSYLPMPRRIHIVGRRNCGKTTLVCDLVRELTARGMKVATVKHTHHRHELDTPGKDSFLHREAGAAGVGILSPQMTAMFIPSDREARGEDRYALFEAQFADCDLILVEGDLHTTATKIEVWRSVCGEAPYALTEPGIRAVVTDDDAARWMNAVAGKEKARPHEEAGPSDLRCPIWSRSELSSVAVRITELATQP